MVVKIKMFAAARELAGGETIAVEVPEGSRVAELRSALLMSVPALAKIIPLAVWAVDARYATDSTPISAGSEVALIPPVSGG